MMMHMVIDVVYVVIHVMVVDVVARVAVVFSSASFSSCRRCHHGSFDFETLTYSPVKTA